MRYSVCHGSSRPTVLDFQHHIRYVSDTLIEERLIAAGLALIHIIASDSYNAADFVISFVCRYQGRLQQEAKMRRAMRSMRGGKVTPVCPCMCVLAIFGGGTCDLPWCSTQGRR